MTTQLIVSDISIRQDSTGRYSLNDLHKAAGNKEKDKPANWLRSEKTIELIDEILISQNREIKNLSQNQKPVISKSGRYGGTYVCKELVYSYAMWISAAFALKVIQAYDNLATGRITQQKQKKSTVDQRAHLRDAVNLLVNKKGLMYPEAYFIVHQRFSVESIDELQPEQLSAAIEYIHRLALEGEYLPKKDLREIIHQRVNKNTDIHNVNALAKHYEAIYTAWKIELYPALCNLNSPLAGRLYDQFKDGYAFLHYLQESINGKHPALIN
ncbi:KilA-N domain-containing protein [Morganella morganii]|uniref:KilA-N domain-containing protein n=1 Tax=Morganella morganii TaxID=582 RepID=UPI001BDA3EEF|nr:KilA-N domain-containing protein [Morganella morganii]MBT0422955.1 KilA-N domain-containing protein [Morganella morganii subsp. morganii]MBT0517553.1 KilA-N domain-containing protein [Morganella morganii subsp. morganii]QWM05650.1 KilA-N domain-containing protein [Morganella morganii subsp. morganii]